VGTFAGAALFYDTERLTYSTSIAVRSSSGKHARGRKITGIEPIWTPDGSEKVLITSNDSRIRVYDLKQKRLARKFRGASYLNRTSQIRASVSEDGNFVIAGSEDAHVYIWDAGAGPSSLLSLDTLQGKGKNSDPPYEYWTAHPGTVTCALVAPLKAHTFLEASEDPISIHASMQQAGKVSQSTTTALTAMSLASAISAAVPHHVRQGGNSAQPTPAFDAKRNRIVCTVDESSKLRVWRADSYQVLRNMAPMLEALPRSDTKSSE
jgi:WD repeat-containing protein 44